MTQNIYGLILNLYLRYKKYLASLSMLRHAVRNPLHIKTVKAKVFAFQCTFIVLAHIGDKFCHLFRSINGKSNRCGYFLCCPLLKPPCQRVVSRSFFADSSYMLSFSVLCSCVCSRLISPSVSSWHKQDNTLMHQSPGHIQRRTPYNF